MEEMNLESKTTIRRRPAERANRYVVVAGGCCTTCCCCCCCIHSIVGLAGSILGSNDAARNNAYAGHVTANAYWGSVAAIAALVALVAGHGNFMMGGTMAFMALPFIQVVAGIPAFFIATREADGIHVADALYRIVVTPFVVSVVVVFGAFMIGAC